jgi:hypothetical protein
MADREQLNFLQHYPFQFHRRKTGQKERRCKRSPFQFHCDLWKSKSRPEAALKFKPDDRGSGGHQCWL